LAKAAFGAATFAASPTMVLSGLPPRALMTAIARGSHRERGRRDRATERIRIIRFIIGDDFWAGRHM